MGHVYRKQTYTCLDCTLYCIEFGSIDVVQKNEFWSCLNCDFFFFSFFLILHQEEQFQTKYLIKEGINWFWRSVTGSLLEFPSTESKLSCNLLRKVYYQLGH